MNTSGVDYRCIQTPVHDGPFFCPECNRPNQFGQLCEACHDGHAEEMAARWGFDDDEDAA